MQNETRAILKKVEIDEGTEPAASEQSLASEQCFSVDVAADIVPTLTEASLSATPTASASRRDEEQVAAASTGRKKPPSLYPGREYGADAINIATGHPGHNAESLAGSKAGCYDGAPEGSLATSSIRRLRHAREAEG